MPRPLSLTPKAQKQVGPDALAHLGTLVPRLGELEDWNADTLEAAVRDYVDRNGLKLGSVAQPLRAALTGKTESPGLFEVMDVLGRNESLARIEDAIMKRGN